MGINKFVFEADPPDTKRIPTDELLGVTVILLTCAYDGREFVRVGYYVNNEYESDELVNDPPAKPVIEKIRRNVLANKPRVTRFAIKWYVHQSFHLFRLVSTADVKQTLTFVCCRDNEASAPAEFPPEQPEADLVADEEEYGAEELAEEEEAEAVEANGEESGDKDAQMEGVEGPEGEGENGVDEDELSDDGSVDIEGESEDELEYEGLEGEGEGEGAEGDEMEVDKPDAAAGTVQQHGDAMVH